MSVPRLTTRRLVLRPLEHADVAAVAQFGGRDFEIARWMTSFPWPYQEGSAEAFVAEAVGYDPLEKEATFVVTLGGVFIGIVSVQAPGDLAEHPKCPTLGYWFGRPFQGFGYATEAARAVLAWAFAAHGVDVIAARAFRDNAASRRVLAKLGFVETGTCVRRSKALDREVVNVVLRLDRAAFEQCAAADGGSRRGASRSRARLFGSGAAAERQGAWRL